MKKGLVFLISIIPMIIGLFINDYIFAKTDVNISGIWMAVCFLVFWMFIGYMTANVGETKFKSAMKVNSTTFIMLIIILFQSLVLGLFGTSQFVKIPQMFYLAVNEVAFYINMILFAFLNIPASTAVTAVIGFLLIFGAYYIGASFNKKKKENF